MCGIVAIVGRDAVASRLFEGLRRLEYRGYDSAGICTVDGQAFDRRRAEADLRPCGRPGAAGRCGAADGDGDLLPVRERRDEDQPRI